MPGVPRNRGMPTKGKPKRRAGSEFDVPLSDRDKMFCERWLLHFDKERAWTEAGFGERRGSTDALKKLERFAEYLRPLREAKARIVGERLAMDGEKVLAAMVARTYFNPNDFYERSTEPLTETVKEGKRKVTRVKMWNGRPVYGERLKSYSDLTPEQIAVVEITGESGGRIHYRLPSIMEQHKYLTSLGTQFGLFAQKLIVERHRHQHSHHHLTFENVPSHKLSALSRQMLPLVGAEFAKSLGYTPEDIAQASVEEGVILPAKEPA